MGYAPEPGGGGKSDYKSFGERDVNVEIDDLLDYYQEMQRLQMDASTPATMELSAMSELIRQGLLQTGGDAGIFPEGVMAAQLMQRRQSDFQHFMKDVLEGVRNIGSAAAVIAEMYDGTDKESAATMNDIAFAFSDPNAKPPAGFRKTESWSEYEQRMAEQSGQTTMAAMGMDDQAQVIHPAAGVTIYLYPDGSSKQVVSTSSSDRYQSGTTTTTTIFAPGGQLLQTNTEQKGTAYGGYQTSTTSTTQWNGDKGGTKSTTSTVTDPQGTITVTNETTPVDKDGNSTGETTTSKPVTIKPGQHKTSDEPMGPVEQAEQQLGTQGTDKYVSQAGQGY